VTGVASVAAGAIYVVALVWAVGLLYAHADRTRLLAPVLIGAGLRLGLSVGVHLASGDGLLYLDDGGYLRQGERLGALWGAGDIVDPAAANQTGTYLWGFQGMLGAAFALTGGGLMTGKALVWLASSATVLTTALVARRLAGDAIARRTAWLCALAPTMVWWAAPLMKESLAALLLTSLLLAALHVDRPRAAAAVPVLALALALVRPAAAAAVAVVTGVVVAVMVVRAGRVDPGRALRRLAAGAVVGAAAVLVLSRGAPVALVEGYVHTIERMIDLYRGAGPERLPFDVVRSFVTPYPWAFDEQARTWDLSLYPGVWVLIALYPSVLAACWAFRRRPEVVAVAAVVVLFVSLNAFTSGFLFRQRSTVEPLLVLLAALGIGSVAAAARHAAVAVSLVAAVAAVQSRGVVAPAAILLAAGGLWALSRRLPDDGARPVLVPTPLTTGRVAWPSPRSLRRSLGRLRVAAPPVPAPPARRSRALAALAALVGAAPAPGRER
jgi:hypothetical protein